MNAEGDSAVGGRRELLEEMWRGRLRGAQKNVEVWQALLSVRSLVLPLHQDSHTWLKFASLARKSGRFRLAPFGHACARTHTHTYGGHVNHHLPTVSAHVAEG